MTLTSVSRRHQLGAPRHRRSTNTSNDQFVHFDFYDENEDLTSADVNVLCYKEVSLRQRPCDNAQNVGE